MTKKPGNHSMFESIISTLHLGENEKVNSKRRFERRDCDHCVSVIEDKTYPVENWSQGGLMIYGDTRPFAVNGELEVTLKFKLRDEVLDVRHRAKVIRKSMDHIAFEFLPLTRQIKKGFQSVVDDYLAAQFAESQLT
jgi:hypothetical protein